MAKSASSAAKKKPAVSLAAGGGGFADYLLTRAPAEDVVAYTPAVLDKAANFALAAVMRHRKGDSVIAIDTDPGMIRNDRAVTVITVVNDNMPFLFDSVLGRDYRHGRRSDARHPSGHRCPARQEGRQRNRRRRRRGQGFECRSGQRHPRPCGSAHGRRSKAAGRGAEQGCPPGARRGRRLETDAGEARPVDI